MVISTSIDISHKVVDGWHIFEAASMPGFYVANQDPRRTFSDVAPTLQTLVKLDAGVDCTVAPSVSFEEFIGPVRSDLTSACTMQRFNIFKNAA